MWTDLLTKSNSLLDQLEAIIFHVAGFLSIVVVHLNIDMYVYIYINRFKSTVLKQFDFFHQQYCNQYLRPLKTKKYPVKIDGWEDDSLTFKNGHKVWVFPKNNGIPKMDGENNGKPY